MSAIYNQVGNTTALNYLLIMRRTKNLKVIQVSKEIWEFPFGQEITITAEHLPGNFNCKVDWESRHEKDSSEWKLCPLIFSKICQILGKKPEIDLLASRLSNQLPIALGSRIPTVLPQILFSRNGITRVYMNSLHHLP